MSAYQLDLWCRMVVSGAFRGSLPRLGEAISDIIPSENNGCAGFSNFLLIKQTMKQRLALNVNQSYHATINIFFLGDPALSYHSTKMHFQVCEDRKLAH